MNHSTTRDLTADECSWLLALARSTIEAALDGRPLPDPEPRPGPLTENRGAFVTLTAGAALRGCIGHVIAAEPLWLSVRGNAVNAAFNDPRFPPVAAHELPGLTIEVSALTPLRAVAGPAEIAIGRDGLVVELGGARGLLLPQVAARYGWSPADFLDQTCRKAGLDAGCWRSPAARIFAFSAQVFSEDE